MTDLQYNPRLILCDIDGTLLEFQPLEIMMNAERIPALPGAVEKTKEWFRKGDMIILVTARPYCWEAITRKQLANAGIIYHQLLMDMPNGPRVLINDYIDEFKAYAFNVKRNVDGIAQIP